MQDLMPPINTPDSAFHDGDPTTGQLGTIVTALWLNNVQSATRDVQAEIKNVLAKAGMTPDPKKNNQLADAISQIVSSGNYASTAYVDNGLNKKIDKASISGVLGNDNSKVPSLNLLTTELGKKQPAGNYADGDRFKTNASNVSISPKNGNIWLILQADGELFTWDGNKSVFRVSSSGEITLGSMSYSRLTNIPVVQTTGNSLTSFMSQKAVTDLVAGLQLKGNYADGSRFQVGSNNVSMTPTNSTYSLALDVGGELLIWDGSKSIFRVSSSGEITLGSMGYSRLKNVPIVQTTGNSATSFMSQKAVTDILVGVGELRDLSGQRAINTTYTNSSSRPRFITITGDSKETGTASVVVNGITIQGLSTGGALTLPFYCSFFVPIGGSYRLNSTGAFNLGRWTELS